MSDIPSLPETPVTASATGSADAAANGHTLTGDVAGTHESLSVGGTAAGEGYSAGVGAHAGADGVSASVGGAAEDASASLDASGGLSGMLEATLGAMHEMASVMLELRALFEAALPL